jgi:hypothetical protein
MLSNNSLSALLASPRNINIPEQLGLAVRFGMVFSAHLFDPV